MTFYGPVLIFIVIPLLIMSRWHKVTEIKELALDAEKFCLSFNRFDDDSDDDIEDARQK